MENQVLGEKVAISLWLTDSGDISEMVSSLQKDSGCGKCETSHAYGENRGRDNDLQQNEKDRRRRPQAF
jgi:hypothetical protein